MRSTRSRKKKKKFTFLTFLTIFFVLGAAFAVYRFMDLDNKSVANMVDSEKTVEDKKTDNDMDNVDSSNGNEEDIKEETDNQDKEEDKDKEQPVTSNPQQSSLEEKVSSLMESMTLEEKIGQMLIVGFESPEPNDHIKKMINDYHVGGVIFYDRNMQYPAQVTNLTNSLQALAAQQEHQIPLSISVDQEGGQIVRMREHVSDIPSQQQLGQMGNSETIFNTAVKTAKELSAMGINLNFAPVLDLSAGDSRSFGEDPEHASKYGNEVIKGLNEGGVTATVKHFPGNGRSNIDPHKDTSSVDAGQLDLENSDIYPFKKAIQEIDNSKFFVMVTHIKYPAYDQENPASISPVIIQDLLREKLGFEGIVVTDDLEMGAVNNYYTPEDLGFKAVEAGADVLLVCHTLDNQQKVFNGILEAVKSGKLSEERIDEAVKRVLTYKFQSIKSIEANPDEAERLVGVN